MLDDRVIIDQVINGDNNAYRIIVERYEGQIASLIMNMIGNMSKAEDIGQEVFVRFYRNISNFRGESSLGTYLMRIAINLCLNEQKKRKSRTRLFVDEMGENIQFIPSETASSVIDTELIRKAISKLNTKYRTVVVLRLIEGYSTAETATILKLPVGTVLSRLSRGQQKLKEILLPLKELIYG